MKELFKKGNLKHLMEVSSVDLFSILFFVNMLEVVEHRLHKSVTTSWEHDKRGDIKESTLGFSYSVSVLFNFN